jgi:hypothetical protein
MPMNYFKKYCLVVFYCISLLTRWINDGTAEVRHRTILVPAFAGGELGIRAANVLALQISKTFQAGKDGKFGRGVLLWEIESLQEMSYAEALRRSTHIGTLAHLVLWGKAYYIKNDVVVQAYLTTTSILHEITQNRPEIWSIKYRPKTNLSSIEIKADLPSRHYSFSPVILSEEAVRRYQSVSALDIFSDRTFTKPIGKIGNGFRAHQYIGDAVRLTSNDVTGWVPLPYLGKNETEVTFFTSGLFRILRGDWIGAASLIDNVLALTNMRQTIYIDTLLLRGLIEEKQGKSGLKWFRKAFSINTLRAGTCQYLIHGLIADGIRKNESASSVDLKSTLNQCRPLFDENDEWIRNADRIISFLIN